MIIPMKKARIVVFKEDKGNLLQSLQKYRVLMITDEATNEASNQNLIERSDKSIKFLTEFAKIKKPLGFLNEATYEELMTFDPKRVDLLNQIESLEQGIISYKNENTALEQEILNLIVFENLDFTINDANNLMYTNFHIGYIDPINIEKVKEKFSELNIEHKFLGRSSELGQAVCFFSYNEETENLLEELRLLSFNETTVPVTNKLVVSEIRDKQKQINDNLIDISKSEEALIALSNSIKEIEILNDQLSSYEELNKIKSHETIETVVITGWVRSDKLEVLDKAISDVTDIYETEITDPEEGETPPVAVKNKKLIEPFESVTDMFSSPGDGDVDPNPVMSIWFFILFGIMMGDAVYGVLMIVLFGVLLKVTKPQGESARLFKMLMYCGVSTIFWGIMFGSYLGFTYKPILIDMMAEPLVMLIYSLVIGVLHIISGLITMAYKNFKNGNYADIFFDQLSWILLLLGIGLFAGGSTILPILTNIGIVMIVYSVLIIIIFGGRKKDNIFGKIIGGVGSLYGITGYMSDILSYSRLLALGLSTAVVGMVMNMLAGMIQGSVIGFALSIIVYIIGHSFNLVMGLLSAYVHDSRLQYIEFFGKFYDGGGEKFVPLSLKLKHIKKVNL